jgi:thioredoxin 1
VRQLYTLAVGFLMLNDDDLEAIRRRKMELLMEKAAAPQIEEPLSQGQVQILTDMTFWNTVSQTKTALIDFFGEWCAPCKQLTPIFNVLAADYKGKVYFAKIDIDRNPRTTAQFGVQSVPMVIGFKHGKPVGKLPGLRPYDEYDAVVEKLLAV